MWLHNRRMHINTMRPRQNCRHFADIFKCIFLNENVWISLKFLLKFVPNVPLNNIPALVQIMAWRRPGTNPLSEPMILLTHVCVIRPQSVKTYVCNGFIKILWLFTNKYVTVAHLSRCPLYGVCFSHTSNNITNLNVGESFTNSRHNCQ